ncbi:N-acetyltransferase [Pseudaminobacter arsenicus]|uniref:N-acetyltransferase n=1 Tax=Borborobacter arsenicus TaxID=1851146 RepID=A0A432V2Y0_9HYPH|nr:GNAT family N-acetyltransferase [Pseudaminobacter arsenicus]RUM96541.1 N-acetyltransferase [Pseudaminobacter arsenicus]
MTLPVATEIPMIETERTLLRAHRLEDLDAYAQMWTDPGVIRFTSGKPLTREEAWIRLLRYAGHWRLLGFGLWAIEDRQTGRFLGEAGFHDLKRDITPSIEGTPEAGWVLVPDAHGKGLATEIMMAAHQWSDAHFSAAKTVCIIDPENTGSLRVAKKCGYEETVRTSYKGSELIMFER